MGYLDKDGLSRAFTKLKTLIDKKQDKMKQICLLSSKTIYKNKWTKFATIDLSSSNAWYICSGTLSFTQGEGGNALGTLKFYCRNGGTAGVIGSSSLAWVSLSDNSYAGSVAYVKAANGKYDMYYKPLKDYETPWITLVDCTAYNLFTFSTNSYVASITTSNTSFVASHASSASSVPWSGVSGKPSTYTPSSHTHDDRYYTKSEVDSKLNGKASSSHTHTKSQITDFPSSMKNPNSLTISLNGTSQGAYNGSAAKSINVTPSSIGAATSGHTHNYAGSSSAGGNATWANGATYANYSYNEKPTTTAGTGAAYTASVSGLTLVSGASFTMVPHTVSTTTTPTLNVNSLGAKNIRMRLSSAPQSTTNLAAANFLAQGRPVKMVYDGTQWIIDDMVRPSATALYGTVPISGGGTGGTTAAQARQNLGITKDIEELQKSRITRGTAAPTSSTGGYIYIQYS